MILDCAAQQYAWGKTGKDSEVARLKKAADPNFDVKLDQNYAELWMGTHPSCPARVAVSGELLSDFLSRNSEAVGLVPAEYTPSDLPFLFKILSIQTALSIQAHPDKALARQLNDRFPQIYKDPNHKPEMALALTHFKAMCGFRSLQDMKEKITEFPEIKSLLSEDVIAQFDSSSTSTVLSIDDTKELFRKMFHELMTASFENVATCLDQLTTRLKSISPSSVLGDLMLQLNKDYPRDIGVLMPIILNYLELNPGECFFMGPNEPHAYISGDCAEAMALSDNVVRAGLTPKLRDVSTLCDMLHYRSGVPSLVNAVVVDEIPSVHRTLLYRPDPEVCSEFEIEVASIDGKSLSLNSVTHFRPLPTASILLFIKSYECEFVSNSKLVGSVVGVNIREGSVVFLPANASASLQSSVASLSPDSEIKVLRAHVNLANLQ